MSTSELDEILSDSAAEVLETMFFTSLTGDGAVDESGEPWLSARLSFDGNPPGSFGVGLPVPDARRMAATFLGEEEESLSGPQVAEVVCELANMLCGSVLSRVEKESRFDLSQPRIEPPEAAAETHTASRTFTLEEGALAVWLDFKQAL